MKVKSESEVTQSWPTLSDPMALVTQLVKNLPQMQETWV